MKVHEELVIYKDGQANITIKITNTQTNQYAEDLYVSIWHKGEELGTMQAWLLNEVLADAVNRHKENET